VSNEVRNLCNSWLGISSVNQNVLINHFEQFSCSCFNNEGNSLLKSLWLSVTWSIWKHRNRFSFNQEKFDAGEIFSLA